MCDELHKEITPWCSSNVLIFSIFFIFKILSGTILGTGYILAYKTDYKSSTELTAYLYYVGICELIGLYFKLVFCCSFFITNEEFGFEKILFGATCPCYLDDYGLVCEILLRVWS